LGEGVGIYRNNLNPILSVVIATLNEEEGVGPSLEELQRMLNGPYLVVVESCEMANGEL
jgi:hypothetical protein